MLREGRKIQLCMVRLLAEGVEVARAPPPPVVEHVVAVVAGTPAAHLQEPGPDRLGRGLDGDAVGGLACGIREQLVAWHPAPRLDVVGPPEALREGTEHLAADEVGTDPDHAELALELAPGRVIAGIDPHLHLDP